MILKRTTRFTATLHGEGALARSSVSLIREGLRALLSFFFFSRTRDFRVGGLARIGNDSHDVLRAGDNGLFFSFSFRIL